MHGSVKDYYDCTVYRYTQKADDASDRARMTDVIADVALKSPLPVSYDGKQKRRQTKNKI